VHCGSAYRCCSKCAVIQCTLSCEAADCDLQTFINNVLSCCGVCCCLLGCDHHLTQPVLHRYVSQLFMTRRFINSVLSCCSVCFGILGCDIRLLWSVLHKLAAVNTIRQLQASHACHCLHPLVQAVMLDRHVIPGLKHQLQCIG
jgi:hypothetical protein